MRVNKEFTEAMETLPDGPGIGVFLDFDRTVIAGYCGLLLLREQIRRGDLHAEQVLQGARALSALGVGASTIPTMLAMNAQFLAGGEETDLRQRCKALFERDIARLIFPESRALIEAHLRKGHTVAIVSSAPEYLVAPAAEFLGIEHVLCSHLQVENGLLTGEVDRPACFGEGKVRAAEQLAAREGIDLRQSCFYTGSHDDISLLEAVGLPRPTNPDKKLGELAARRGWPVQRWTSRGLPSAGQLLRSILATGSLLASVAASLPIRALTGSRRKAQNFSTSLYADVASALIGLNQNVRGEENLWKARPAVFVFNHQSKADFIILAQLLRRDFAGVARRHSGGLRLFHQAMEAGGVVLLDLDQPRETMVQMRTLAKDIREQGISVAIAPEGTRSIGVCPGTFNRGAFHLAMQAGVPVVPVVIHNAGDVAPKGDFIFHAATVEVDILPPVDTRQWQKATLPEHVREIRQQFLDVLGVSDPE